MKIIIATLLLLSCGTDRTYRRTTGPIVIDSATITIEQGGLNLGAVVINHVEGNRRIFKLKSNINPKYRRGVLRLGNIKLQSLDINNLYRCGGKCNNIGVRIFTRTPGFYNRTHRYSLPILADGNVAGQYRGFSTMVTSASIPPTMYRVRKGLLPDRSWNLDVGGVPGVGNYKAVLIIELVIW